MRRTITQTAAHLLAEQAASDLAAAAQAARVASPEYPSVVHVDSERRVDAELRLAKIRVLWRQPDLLALWGIPYERDPDEPLRMVAPRGIRARKGGPMNFRAERNKHGAWMVVFGAVAVIPCQADDPRDDQRLASDVAHRLNRDEQAAVLAAELPAGARTWRMSAIGIIDRKRGAASSSTVDAADALYRKAKDAREKAGGA